MKHLVALGLLTPCLLLSAAAQEIGTLTMRDGPLRVIRGCALMQGVEGMRLRQADILETAPAGMAQLEFLGGIVALGPSSRLLLLSYGRPTTELVLLSGWLKGETNSGPAYRYASPLLTVTAKNGAVILHSDAGAAEVNVEAGSATVSAGGLNAMPSSKTKNFFSRRSGKPVSAADRPAPSFVSAMPVPFRDTLPSRLPRFEGKKPPEPKREREVSYAEVERWLTLAPGFRRGFVTRFKPRLQDAAFRKAIEDHLAALPDWKPILHLGDHETPPSPANESNSPPGRYRR